jgi:hypothetical protein
MHLPNSVQAQPNRTSSQVIGLRRRWQPFLVLTLLVGCKGCEDTLEVFPASVQIPADGSEATFEAYARLRAENGKIRNNAIKWKSSNSAVTLDADQGRHVLVTVNAAAAADYEITVTSKDKTDVLKIRVESPSGDQARANRDNSVSSVVAMFGKGTGCPNDSTFTFVGRANLGDWNSSCVTSDVIVFTDYRAPYKWPGPWQDPIVGGFTVNDDVDATSATPQPNVQKVKVWRLELGDLSFVSPTPTPDQFAKDLIQEQLATAKGIFDANRGGVMFAWDGTVTYLPSSAASCQEVVDFIMPYGTSTPDPSRWEQSQINVYLVADAPTGSRAEFCWNWEMYPLWPKNVIRVQTRPLMNTLAHEFGHIFGLYVPWGPQGKYSGHTEDFKGFAIDNLMYAGAQVTSSAARTRFSLGQVYRMHFDLRSRLGGASDCGCDPYGGSVCGRLSRDVRAIKDDDGVLDAPSQICGPPP